MRFGTNHREAPKCAQLYRGTAGEAPICSQLYLRAVLLAVMVRRRTGAAVWRSISYRSSRSQTKALTIRCCDTTCPWGPAYLSNAATIIAVILFSDEDLNRALTQTAVVVGGLLRVANIHVVQFERLAGAHLFEWVFLVGPDFVDRRFSCFFNHRPYPFFTRVVLCETERLKRGSALKADTLQHHKRSRLVALLDITMAQRRPCPQPIPTYSVAAGYGAMTLESGRCEPFVKLNEIGFS